MTLRTQQQSTLKVMKKLFSKNILQYTYVFCIVYLVLIFLINPHYVSLGNVLETWAIDRGLVLYKDIASFHFPLGRVTSLILYRLTGWNLQLTPLVGLAIGITNLYLIFKIAKKHFEVIPASIALLFFAFLYWYYGTGISFYHEQQIGIFLTLAVYLIDNPLLVGVTLSLAEFSGQVASPTVAILYLVYIGYIYLKKQKHFLKNLAISIAGLTVVAIPIFIYFYLKNALGDFLFWNIGYYTSYAKETSAFIDLPFLDLAIFFSPLALVLGLILKDYWAEKRPDLVLLASSLITISIIPFTVFSVFHFHHFSYALPLLSIVLGYILNKGDKKLVCIFGIVFSLYICFRLIPWHRDRFVFPTDWTIRNDVRLEDSDYKVISWLKENSSINERILVIGNAMVYIRSNRFPSTRPSHSIPYSWVPFEVVKKEVANNPPVYYLTDKAFTSRLIRDYNHRDMYEFIIHFTDECYKKVLSVDTWTVWKRTCN